VVVTYKLPFNLNVESRRGLAECTKSGSGGEQPGDILRYTTQYTMSLPGGEGLADTIGAFGGVIKWKPGLFDVNKAVDWDEVLEALVSNTPERAEEVTLVFERPVSADAA
jgi:hypothetical protein